LTFMELINRVLTAVGQGDEPVVAAVTDTYQLKVAQFVNDFLQEVEGAAPWRVLRTRVSATVLANGNSIVLSGVNERTRLWREIDARTRDIRPICFDVTNTSAQKPLTETDLATLLRADQENSNQALVASPSHFAVEQTATGVTLYVHPRVNANCTVEVDLLVPQARLDPTSSSDLATAIKVPALPVQYGASWWAMEDRGEELGPRGDKAEKRYRDLLADAVADELTAQGYDELVPQ
jgi:hypothetical protein